MYGYQTRQVSQSVSQFIFANKSTKEALKWTKVKNTIRFWLENADKDLNHKQLKAKAIWQG